MSRTQVPKFEGNINFNAQHSPAGAFMSFTCGHFGAGGGIGLEIGRPASQDLFVGVKRGDRKSRETIRCLPFLRTEKVPPVAPVATDYDVAHSQQTASAINAAPRATAPPVEPYPRDEVTRRYGWATDTWETPDLTFTIYTQFGRIPEPGACDSESLRASLLPAVIATLEVDNTKGDTTKTAVFAIDFIESGARVLAREDTPATAECSVRCGFAKRRSMGVLGELEGADKDGLFAVQRWSIAEGLADVNTVHELGACAGLAFEVPPGEKRTLVLAIGAYLDGVVTTGLEGHYYYTRCYTSLEDVLDAALDRSAELRDRARKLDVKLLTSGLSADQQFLVAHGTRSFYGSTQLLDVGGEPFWIVNEGEYCMMNTLDLAIDHAFWELQHHPWVVRNLLDNFTRYYSYHDQVHAPGSVELLPGGISFCHDMGVNNNFSRSGHSSYELAQLNGCFSYMTQEQLCNWVLLATCYVTKTGDTRWLVENGHVLTACAESMLARASSRSGIMAFDSSRCSGGQEITTYDSLDESLGQARANTYIAVKCWAASVALDMLTRLRQAAGADGAADSGEVLTDLLASSLLASMRPDGTLPAVLEKDNPGYQSRILPVVESLVYPAYWIECLTARGGHPDVVSWLRGLLRSPLVSMLRRHTAALLSDEQRRNLFADGGIRLSSTSDNSWMSKIALFQHVARVVLHLNGEVSSLFDRADAAHVTWQTDGSAHWACSDQFVNGVAKGSRYYPRIITAALWLEKWEAASDSIASGRPATKLETI